MDRVFVSELNRDVPPAAEGEFSELNLGSLSIWPPVVLAPMAGVTNYPFRSLCRGFGAGLYVSEMITAKALIYDSKRTWKLAQFGEDESPRSLQLYGADPEAMGEAARRLTSEGLVDHLDLNFGCPVRKVTRKGGGAAIPLKPRLMEAIVRAVVGGAGDIPVTMKVRMGVSDDLMTWRDSARVAEAEGIAAIGLHARTAEQLYDGAACWDIIGEMKASISIPVLGNGDIWEGEDALRMMRQTGCDGVIVGRGCLGRPWLFRDLSDLFDGRTPLDPPTLGGVSDIMLDHANRLIEWVGEVRGIKMMRRFATWYTKSFVGSAALRAELTAMTSLREFEGILAGVERDTPFPASGLRVRRGKSSGRQQVTLPEGFLDDLQDATPPEEPTDMPSGG